MADNQTRSAEVRIRNVYTPSKYIRAGEILVAQIKSSQQQGSPPKK